MPILHRLSILAFALGIVASPVQAAGDAARGKETAERWCSSCHAVGQAGRATDMAPSFAAIGARRDEDYLRGFLSRPHPPMPRLELSRQDIDDLIAYIAAQTGQ